VTGSKAPAGSKARDHDRQRSPEREPADERWQPDYPIDGQEPPIARRRLFARLSIDRLTKLSIVGMFLIAFVAALHFAAAFFMPVTLAFLFALTFSPVVRGGARIGIPAPLTALGIVLALFAGVAVAGYMLSGPVSGWINQAPAVIEQVSAKFERMNLPVDALMELSKDLEEAAQGGAEPGQQQVVVQTTNFLQSVASSLAFAGATIVITMVLLFFLLASGTHFYEKLVQSFSSMKAKKRALSIVYSVEKDVSRYLLTITVINTALGCVIAGAMALLGMPSPLLWGVGAMVLNFVPYLGALIGVVLSAFVALIVFDSVGQIVAVPLIYLAITSIEGQIITPLFVGRRLEINEVFVFLCVGFFGWLWGIVGALIAVPILVVIKTVADHAEGPNAISHFLTASIRKPQNED
jgi:predicted PurR-regulated permease PerM